MVGMTLYGPRSEQVTTSCLGGRGPTPTALCIQPGTEEVLTGRYNADKRTSESEVCFGSPSKCHLM